jgi:hypothetical protein
VSSSRAPSPRSSASKRMSSARLRALLRAATFMRDRGRCRCGYRP